MKFFLPSNKNYKYIKNFFKSSKLNDLIKLSEKTTSKRNDTGKIIQT